MKTIIQSYKYKCDCGNRNFTLILNQYLSNLTCTSCNKTRPIENIKANLLRFTNTPVNSGTYYTELGRAGKTQRVIKVHREPHKRFSTNQIIHSIAFLCNTGFLEKEEAAKFFNRLNHENPNINLNFIIK